MMKYGYTILYVKEVEATLAFYQKAFGFERKFITPEKDYAELVSGETTIAFASVELGKAHLADGFVESSTSEKPFGIELAFVTENIDEDFSRAKKAGAMEVQAIAEKPWGQRVGYLRDHNGFLIELCSPVKME